MLTNRQIQCLIDCPKTITKKEPAIGYREDGRHLRCDLELESVQDSNVIFKIFVRREYGIYREFLHRATLSG